MALFPLQGDQTRAPSTQPDARFVFSDLIDAEAWQPVALVEPNRVFAVAHDQALVENGQQQGAVFEMPSAIDLSGGGGHAGHSSQLPVHQPQQTTGAPNQDLATGVMAEHGPAPVDECVEWFGDEVADVRTAFTEDGRLFFGPFDGPWEIDRDFGVKTRGALTSFRPNHRFFVVSDSPDRSIVMLLDDRTGELVGPPIEPGGFLQWAGANADGSLFAFSFGIQSRPEGDGLLVIVDGETSEEVFHVDSPEPVSSFTWDEAAGQLVASTFDGLLLTVDLQGRM